MGVERESLKEQSNRLNGINSWNGFMDFEIWFESIILILSKKLIGLCFKKNTQYMSLTELELFNIKNGSTCGA